MRGAREDFERELQAKLVKQRADALKKMGKYEAAVRRGVGKTEARAMLAEAEVFDEEVVCQKDAMARYCLNVKQVQVRFPSLLTTLPLQSLA